MFHFNAFVFVKLFYGFYGLNMYVTPKGKRKEPRNPKSLPLGGREFRSEAPILSSQIFLPFEELLINYQALQHCFV